MTKGVYSDDVLLLMQEYERRVHGLERLVNDAFVYSTAPTASILLFGGDVPPNGYLMCDGMLTLIPSYMNLFNIIGFKFTPVSAGGSGTDPGGGKFYVPDYTDGKYPRGAVIGAVGVAGGSPTHIHVVDPHTHTGPLHSHTYSGTTSYDTFHATGGSTSTAPPAVGAHDHTYSGTTSSDGTGVTGSASPNTNAANNDPPHVDANFIIKT